MTNLTRIAYSLADLDDVSQLRDAQREELTAACMLDMGDNAYEAIEWMATDKVITDKLIEALQETNMADRNVLLKEIGEILMKEAIRCCGKQVEEALEDAQSEIAAESGLISEGALELQRLIADDNRQRI